MTKKSSKASEEGLSEVPTETKVRSRKIPEASLRDSTNLIVVHCSATKRDLDIGFSEIDVWHKGRGWVGCGYHKIIRLDGTVEDGRDLDAVGAHAYGYNMCSIGICLVGGIGDSGRAVANFSSPQYDALWALLKELVVQYPDVRTILGHRDLSPDIDGDGVIEKWEWTKECPCFSVSEFIAARGGLLTN